MTTPSTSSLNADVMQLPGSGQVNNAWNGVPNSGDSILFANSDIDDTWYLGFRNTITIGGTNTIPVPPNGTVTLTANRTVYAIAVKGANPLIIIPGGGAYFQGLTQGQGKLVLPAIQSPNFLSQVDGWTINKDGSAEFNNLTVRGTFFGTNFVLNQSGIFFYDPTETLGNLVVSITPKATTGPLGESVTAGLTIGKVADVQLSMFRDPVFATGIFKFFLNNATFNDPLIDSAISTGPPPFAAMLLQGGSSKTVGFRDKIQQLFNSSDGIASFANMSFRYITDTGASFLYSQIDGSGVGIRACSQLTATDPTTGTGPGNVGQSETWHDMRPLQNSFLGTIAGSLPPQYRKTADGSIQFAGNVRTPPTTGNYNNVAFCTLPVEYRPPNVGAGGRPQWCITDAPAAGAVAPKIVVKETGDLVFVSLPTSLVQTTFGIWGNYELGNTGMILS